MTKQSLFGGTLLLCGVFSGFLSGQAPGSITGKVALQSTGDGIPEVAVTLCQDFGRDVVSETSLTNGPLPPRNQVNQIRLTRAEGQQPQVTVASTAADCANARRATTDNTGRFAFNDVAPGSYKVHVQRDGYIGESLRGSPPAVVTQTVAMTPEPAVREISFSLIKGGTIAGTVLDPNGKPLTSATIQVLSARSGATPFPLATMQSDDRGQYRLFWLPPGEFIVAVRPSATVINTRTLADGQTATPTVNFRQAENAPSYALTYYRNSLSTTDAKAISLREGEDVPGIDVVVLPLQ